LDETYERTLQGIAREKREHARRLFQCLVAAARPLQVHEVAEVLANEYSPIAEPSLMRGWRPKNPEEAVLSTCSTLVAIVEDKGSKIVQFSHFSVKEFLTSDRLQTSEFGNVRHYHIPLDAAHITLARLCFTMLLPSEEEMDMKRVKALPLAPYSARHWVDHVKFENVASQFEESMERLFDPKKPHFKAWIHIHNIDDGKGLRQATPLYYAVLCGFTSLAKRLIVVDAEDVNANCGYHGSPLHAASYRGHIDAVRLLLGHGADVNTTMEGSHSPLCSAYDGDHLEVMRLLLERGADANVAYSAAISLRLLHYAAGHGKICFLQLLLQHKADVNAKGKNGATSLHCASARGQLDAMQILLDHGADANSQTVELYTPLFVASERGHLETVRVLLRHGANVHLRNMNNRTPFHRATRKGHVEVAQLLLDYGAERE
jgi:ankyrin repeat protein